MHASTSRHVTVRPSGRVLIAALALVVFGPVPGRAELVAHWTFDADSRRDGFYADSSGKNRDATVVGTVAPVPADAPVGQAVQLPGDKNANHLTTPYFNDLSGRGKSFTIAAWVKIDTGVPSVTYPIFSSWDKETALLFWVNGADGKVRFQIRNAEGQPVFRGDKPENMSTLAIADDQWTHVAVVWTAGDEKGCKPGTLAYYVNGTPAGSMTSLAPTGGAFLRDQSAVPSKTFDIGMKRDKGETLKGGLDDLRVYSHALKPEEMVGLVPKAKPDARAPDARTGSGESQSVPQPAQPEPPTTNPAPAEQTP